MTRWRENKDKRGVKATKFIFSTEQEKILYDHGWELEQNISTIAKGRALKNNPHVTAWKKKIAKDIIDRPEFTTLDLDEHSLSEWLSGGIIGWFTNYFNRYIAKTSVTIDLTQQARNSESTRDGRAANKLLRSFALFSSDISPKELFARENPDAVQERMAEILEQRGKGFPHGAARNMGLQELWEELTSSEKNNWKERAQNLAEDVTQNRSEFPFAITNALQTLCDHGRLGTIALALHYAYRNEAGGLECACIYAGKNVDTGEKLNVKMKEADQWQDSWRDHVKQVLPMPGLPKANLIKLSDDGIPLFPNIDTDKILPDQVASVLEEYITALWKKASPVSHAKGVRWTAIANEPAMFYDITQFKLPYSLKPAREMLNSPGQLYTLITYFKDLQKSGQQFQFRRHVPIRQPVWELLATRMSPPPLPLQ